MPLTSLAELETIVASMRSLGVTELRSGDVEVRLGPPPTPKPDAPPKPATRREQAQAELADWRAETEAMVAANGRAYSDDELDRLRPPPRVLLEAAAS